MTPLEAFTRRMLTKTPKFSVVGKADIEVAALEAVANPSARVPSDCEIVSRAIELEKRVLALEKAKVESSPPAYLPDAGEFLWKALTGRSLDNATRAFWLGKKGRKISGQDAIEHSLDKREISDPDVWGVLGILDLVALEPHTWVKVSPLVFVIGVYQKCFEKAPSVHVTLSLLECIWDGGLTPRGFLLAFAADHKVPASKVSELEESLRLGVRAKYWPWNRFVQMEPQFDHASIAQSMILVRILRKLNRISWSADFTDLLYSAFNKMAFSEPSWGR